MNPAVAQWALGAVLAIWGLAAVWALVVRWVRRGEPTPDWAVTPAILGALGSLCLAGLIAHAWVQMGRPPMRTLGETRLWYGFFLSAAGVLMGFRWKSSLLLFLSLAMAALFLSVNLMSPQVWNQAIMPALRSPWFVPHVAVYLLAYALLGAAFAGAVWDLFRRKTRLPMDQLDHLVRMGFAFLTLGQVFGALWAKEAWGHYWAWDPKETWALLTWISFLIYLHVRHHLPDRHRLARFCLVFGFLVLLLSWFGIHSLPVAGQSVHVYSQK